jgi:hypothetical protein
VQRSPRGRRRPGRWQTSSSSLTTASPRRQYIRDEWENPQSERFTNLDFPWHLPYLPVAAVDLADAFDQCLCAVFGVDEVAALRTQLARPAQNITDEA